MSTYTQILYHIVFSTKKREHTLIDSNRKELFKYVSGILKNKKCHLYRIGGISDHIHIATHIHPLVSLSSLVKDIKLASTDHIKTNKLFPYFNGWQDGYAGFTYSYSDKDKLIEYVKNQEIHHKKKTFREELIELLKEHGIEFEYIQPLRGCKNTMNYLSLHSPCGMLCTGFAGFHRVNTGLFKFNPFGIIAMLIPQKINFS